MNVRTLLADQLRAALPPKWDVIDHGVTLENPTKPVVVVKQTNAAKNPGAPRMYRDFTFTLGLVEPGLDVDKVEDALDADLDLVLDALDTLEIPGLLWTGADRVTFDSRFHGYEIHVNITTEKDTP